MVFKKGCIPWNKDKHNVYSEEVLEKNRLAHTGSKQSLETRNKRSISMKKAHAEGRHSGAFKIGDRRNLNKIRTPEMKEKNRLWHIGRRPWNKDLTKETDERVMKYAKTKTGYIPKEETIKKLKEKRKLQITPKFDTSIEIKIQDFLDKLNIEYSKHQYMPIQHGYQCDIFIPSLNLVIEADGNFWHNFPNRTEIDNLRTSELIEKGFKVLRLWETEINKLNIEEFLKLLNNSNN